MQDKELNFIIDYTLTKVEKLGEHFTYSKLAASNIHPAIAKYISSRVEYLIYVDREKLLNESAFDYSGTEISKLQHKIAGLIKKESKVPLKQVTSIITQAVRFNSELLSAPNKTLLNLIFEDSNEVSIDEIKIRLNYLYYHGYLSDTLNSYLGKIKTLTIKKSRFEEILRKIDRIIYDDKDKELTEYTLNSMADFYNIGNSDKSRVPIEHIREFLTEKNLIKYIKNLELFSARNTATSIDANEAYYILFVKEPEETEIEIERPQTNENKEVEFELTEENNTDALYDFPGAEEVEQRDETKKTNVEHKEEKSVPDEEIEFEEQFIDDKIELPEGFERTNEKTFSIESEDEEDLLKYRKARKREIVSFLSNKEMERIVASIFNDDREDFASILETISDSKNYEEATGILKKVFNSYNVNPYSKEAIAFTNSVSSYFEQG